MCDCICSNCQFENFFNAKPQKNKKLFYYKDEDTDDEYCIFHSPEKIKSDFSYHQNELLKTSTNDYIKFCLKSEQRIDFSLAIFHIPFDIKDLKTDLKVDFTKTIFLEYFRMDNLHCKELIFKDTEFHKGGGIKNRNREDNIHIEKLIFRPFSVQSDFVIDIGQYANEEGGIETKITGTIKEIEFENHKEGNGIVYFVGLNEKTEKADFRNRILDNVSFQNCDLSHVYFLNSKIDKTEFRNCEFPHVEEGLTLNVIDEANNDIKSLFSGLFLMILLYLLGSGLIEVSFLNNENFIYKLLQVIYPFIPLLVIAFVIPIFKTIYYIEFFISHSIPENKFQFINKIKTIHYHKGTADEVKITPKIGFTVSSENKSQMQEILSSIEALYRQLKVNFNKKDFQLSGDFFFSQRLMEVYGSKYKDNLIERSILIIHHGLNGFGEKFIKPAIFFIATLFIFTSMYNSNKDFIATDQTPKFFTIVATEVNQSMPYYRNQIFSVIKDGNSSITKKKFIPEKLDNDWITKFTYSASQFISPFTAKNRAWFKTVSSKAAILNIIEMILLYLFFGAFILALKNRIKR